MASSPRVIKTAEYNEFNTNMDLADSVVCGVHIAHEKN